MARMNLLNLSGLPWMKAKQTHEGAPAKHISAEAGTAPVCAGLHAVGETSFMRMAWPSPTHPRAGAQGCRGEGCCTGGGRPARR